MALSTSAGINAIETRGALPGQSHELFLGTTPGVSGTRTAGRSDHHRYIILHASVII